MSLTIVKGLRSEIPIPKMKNSIRTKNVHPLQEMTIALVTAAGIYPRDQKPFNLAGDYSFREISDDLTAADLKVSHHGYDNVDVNKDMNCMFPIDILHRLEAENFIKGCAPVHIGFMGGVVDFERISSEMAPEIVEILKKSGTDGVVLTAGWGTCHRSAVVVQKVIEESGIPTVLIAALPTIAQYEGTPRQYAPASVSMSANAGEPNNVRQQKEILKQALSSLIMKQ